MNPLQSSEDRHEQASFGSYTSYIGNILNQWPEYHWLHQRLRSLSSRDISFVTIWDFKGEAVSCEDFACGENGGEVANKLKYVAADVSSRVVMLSSKAWRVNKPFLDTLGLIYDIDPLFFWRHLAEVSEEQDESSLYDDVSEESAPHGLVTDSSSTHFGFRLYLHGSIMEVDNSPEINRKCPTGKSLLLKAKTLYFKTVSSFHHVKRKSTNHRRKERLPIYSPLGKARLH